MVAKHQRLRANRDFARCVRRGRAASGRSIRVYVHPTSGTLRRLGVSVGKGVGKSAVRNRIKRLLREAARDLVQGRGEGMDLVLVARCDISAERSWRIREELLNLLCQLKQDPHSKRK